MRPLNLISVLSIPFSYEIPTLQNSETGRFGNSIKAKLAQPLLMHTCPIQCRLRTQVAGGHPRSSFSATPAAGQLRKSTLSDPPQRPAHFHS